MEVVVGAVVSKQLSLEVGAACIGAGFCRRTAPDVFGATRANLATVLVQPAPDGPDVWDAMESCPVEAISARDAATGEQLFP